MQNMRKLPHERRPRPENVRRPGGPRPVPGPHRPDADVPPWRGALAASILMFVAAVCGCTGPATRPIGNVIGTWIGDGADPAVLTRPGTTDPRWRHRYDLTFPIKDDTSVSVDRHAVVAVLVDGVAGVPAVVKVGSDLERTAVHFKREPLANGREQLVCRLYSGAVQVYLGGKGEPPADDANRCRAVVRAEADPDALAGLLFDGVLMGPPPGRGPGWRGGGNVGGGSNQESAGAGLPDGAAASARPVYLRQVPGPIVIGGGKTVFVVGWLEGRSKVYCACELELLGSAVEKSPKRSVVVVQRGDQLLTRVESEQEVEVPRQAIAGREVAAPVPLSNKYGQVTGAIRQLNVEAPRALAERLRAERQFLLAYEATRHVAPVEGSFSGVGVRSPAGR